MRHEIELMLEGSLEIYFKSKEFRLSRTKIEYLMNKFNVELHENRRGYEACLINYFQERRF